MILAGVTIAQLTESGLFNKTKLAEQKSENSQIKEELTLGDYENKIGKYVESTRETQIISDYKSDGTEIKTNEKLDGKPIYARYFSIEISSNNFYDVEHHIANVNKIWIDVGNSYAVEDGYYYNAPLIGGGATYRVNETYVSTFPVGSYWNGKTVTLLLKYTKTTD